MDDFFDDFQTFEWAAEDYFHVKDNRKEELNVENPSQIENGSSINDKSEELMKEIASIDQHCSNLIKIHVNDKEKENGENLLQSYKEKPRTKLKDPPDINEILAADEESIEASAHNVTILNGACQKVLKEIEHTLLIQLRKNKKEQETVLNYLSENERNKSIEGNKKTNIKCLGIPFFKDANGYPPPLNEDVQRKKRCNKLLPVDFINGSHVWSNKDYKTLIKAVIESSKTNSTGESVNSKDIDWMKISATHMKGKYSSSECKSKWIMNLSPNVNKSKWTMKEMKQLRELAKKYKYQNWDKIAEELKTNRTGFQCCVQYQTHKSPFGERWTKKEDETLLQLIKEHKIKDHIPWKKVVWNFEGRSLRQCQERYAYHLQNIKKGSFTMEEDYVLIYLYSKLKSFKEVAKYFPKRVSTQIRARYEYLVKMTMPEFSKEEDELLTQLMVKYPRNWAKISGYFKDRSKLQCRGRWAAIQKQISLTNDSFSESEGESSNELSKPDESDNMFSSKDEIDSKIINKKLNHVSKPKPKEKCQKKFSEQYKKLLEYCKCGYKFLLGPKPRLPSNLEERDKLCTKMKIAMRNLSISSIALLNAFDIDSLSASCEFDVEDLTVLNEIKKYGEKDNSRKVEINHKILPPNYMTLVGLRTLMLGSSNIKNLSSYYKQPNQTSHVDKNDRILFCDAKKLFKSRLKTLFAFPLVLSNISQEGMETADVPAKKSKRVKPLSLRKRRIHGKKIQAFRKKIKTALDKKFSNPDGSMEIVGSGLNRNHCQPGEPKENQSRVEENGDARVKRKRGRPRKAEAEENGASNAKRARPTCQ